MSRQWFYTRDNERQGPVSAAELKQLAATGNLSRLDLVWAEGMGDWKPAGRMKGQPCDPGTDGGSASGGPGS